MPKKIENLRAHILQDARKILEQQGYEELTIRRVADDCNIAVGTVYNYFPSKEMLAGSVMLEDWQKILQEASIQCSKAKNLPQAVKYVYQGVLSFAEQYRSAWRGYAFTGSETMAFKKRHILLITQIAQCLEPLTATFKQHGLKQFDLYIAENILACVNGSPVKLDELIRIIVALEKSYE